MKKIDCWKIRILSCSDHPLKSKNYRGEPILELKKFESIKLFTPLSKSTTIEADPFLFVKEDRLFLFYESKILGEPGVIKMTYTTDLKKWTEPQTVLKEECHLSFPFVFEDNDEVYMIPETGGLGEIRLYKASDRNLSKWEYIKTLIKDGHKLGINDLSYCDSSITKIENNYFLFTTLVRDKVNELHLYYASNLDHTFIEHPDSPIVKSNSFGRNAGSIINYQNKLYRVSQECSHSYGQNINLHIINELTTSSYQEDLIRKNLFNKDAQFYNNGAHQLSIVYFRNKYIVATDAKGYKRFFVQRILSKINH